MLEVGDGAHEGEAEEDEEEELEEQQQIAAEFLEGGVDLEVLDGFRQRMVEETGISRRRSLRK